VELDCSQCVIVGSLCVWIIQGNDMSGQRVFEQLVSFADITTSVNNAVSKEDYELWKKDFVWEALHGQRYGQSFCNRFGITDNHLYYTSKDIDWCDEYIRTTYLA
jgi:hypothetical protein